MSVPGRMRSHESPGASIQKRFLPPQGGPLRAPLRLLPSLSLLLLTVASLSTQPLGSRPALTCLSAPLWVEGTELGQLASRGPWPNLGPTSCYGGSAEGEQRSPSKV